MIPYCCHATKTAFALRRKRRKEERREGNKRNAALAIPDEKLIGDSSVVTVPKSNTFPLIRPNQRVSVVQFDFHNCITWLRHTRLRLHHTYRHKSLFTLSVICLANLGVWLWMFFNRDSSPPRASSSSWRQSNNRRGISEVVTWNRFAGPSSSTCSCVTLSKENEYMVTHIFVDLGWVDFELGVPPSCPSAQPLLPNSHKPRPNWADSGALTIQVNPVHKQIGHPVVFLALLWILAQRECKEGSTIQCSCVHNTATQWPALFIHTLQRATVSWGG